MPKQREPFAVMVTCGRIPGFQRWDTTGKSFPGMSGELLEVGEDTEPHKTAPGV